MKIISWNLNGIRAAYKKGLMEFLERESPDIFCVQETKAHPEQVPEELLEPLSMFSYWSSAERKGYSGTATFTKVEPRSVTYGVDHGPYDTEGRFVITEHDDFKLYNIYFPNGARSKERHDFKQKFLKDMNTIFKRDIDEGHEVIVLGDYNVAPNEIDIYDPVRHAKTSGFLPEEREWFESFLKLGFTDTFRHIFPDEKERYTWWNQRERARLGNRGWRIDMICITEGLMDRLIGADIMDHVEGSDHCPIAIELEE